MSTRSKILLTVILAVLFVYLFGCDHREHYYQRVSGTSPSLQRLDEMVEQDNEKYFYGALPVDNIRVEFMDSDEDMGRLEHREKYWVILVDRRTNPVHKLAALTVHHEECHLYDRVQHLNEGLDGHDFSFQFCMRRLAASNAFEELW